MTKKIVLAIIVFGGLMMTSCKDDRVKFNLKQEEVVATLTAFGKANQEKNVILKTELGDIHIKLYDETPLHRANFLRLVKGNYYNDAFFYRLVDGFLAQGGNNTTIARPLFTVPMELSPNIFHKRGAIAMASDKPKEMSSATEFYIISGRKYSKEKIAELKEFGMKFTPEQEKVYETEGGYDPLDGKYTVFGEVTQGLDIVDKIANGKIYNTDQSLEKIKFSIKTGQ